MSGPAIRTGSDVAGGTIRPSGTSKTFVEGHLVGVVGDPVDGHGAGVHASPVMVGGSSKVFIEDKAALRGGVDPASCGHMSSSSSKVIIGG